jgi:translocation and assembly module TamA
VRFMVRRGTLITAIFLMLTSAVAGAEEDGKLTVVIEGLEGRLKENVAAFLEIETLADKVVTSEARLPWLHSRAKDDIAKALEPFGYYKPVIDARLERTATGWLARYRIDPGPPLPMSRVDVQVSGEGSRDPAFEKLLANLPLAKGQVLERSRYDQLKETLQELATERGYFDARLLVHEIRVNLQAYSAEVILHFDTGERYRFGQITFRQDALAPEFLRRYLDFQPGSPYEVSDLLKLQSDLIASDYFSEVEVEASPDQAVDRALPVNVILQPRRSTLYSLGLGYGTDTGPRGTIDLKRPCFNRWGHHYQVSLLASQVQSGFAGQYIIPGKDPRSDRFSLNANLLAQKFDTVDSRQATASISKQYQDGAWQKIASVSYLWEVSDFSSGNRQTSRLLIPSLNWTHVKADNRLNVTYGHFLNLLLQGAYQPLLSDASFLQGIVNAKWIKTLNAGSRIVVRGNLGTTVTSDFDKLPASLRFFAGGDNSIRGYSFDSISPENAEGKVVGGKNLLVGSLEYQHRLRDKWSLAGFVDSGDAFDSSPRLKTGVGVGVLWQSPVGPLRAYLASGLDSPGDSLRLHFVMGPDL